MTDRFVAVIGILITGLYSDKNSYSIPQNNQTVTKAQLLYRPRMWYQMNPVPALHDTHTRNHRQKNGVDLWRRAGFWSVCRVSFSVVISVL